MGWFKNKQKLKKRQPQLMAGQNDYVFRRSRTIVGSVSSEVIATAENRGQLKTDRLKIHELRAHLGHVLKLFFGVIAICVLLSFLVVNFVFVPEISIGQIGLSQPDLKPYHQAINNYFADHPLERFGFLLKADDLDTYLKTNQTELANTTIDRDWYGGNVRTTLFFRQPLLVWKVGHEQFYVDAQGMAFRYNHFAEPTLKISDQSGVPADQSGVVASSRFIRFLGRLVGALDTYNKGKVTEIIIPKSTREVDLKLQGRGYVIKTNIDRDPLQQAEDIASSLAYLDTHGLQPGYIDLRVAHKAFYK